MSAFDRAWAFLQRPEIEGGGLVSEDPEDPGGLTKWGISQRAYPDEDIRNMTEARAKELFRRDYWDEIRGDDLPQTVAIALVDSAFNQGVLTAMVMFQAALGVKADGIFGPVTMAAAWRQADEAHMNDFLCRRLLRYANGHPKYRRGWFLRVLRLKDAVSVWRGSY